MLSHTNELNLLAKQHHSPKVMQRKDGTNYPEQRLKEPSLIPEAFHTDRTEIPAPYTPPAPIQKKENNTGLPDRLKTGIENLSGYSMDDVKVHYNFEKPAQLQAHAYAQGTDIHLASGQEKHLSHEAWHVVKQKQGRVKPTIQMKGEINTTESSSEPTKPTPPPPPPPPPTQEPVSRPKQKWHVDMGQEPGQWKVGSIVKTDEGEYKITENGNEGSHGKTWHATDKENKKVILKRAKAGDKDLEENERPAITKMKKKGLVGGDFLNIRTEVVLTVEDNVLENPEFITISEPLEMDSNHPFKDDNDLDEVKVKKRLALFYDFIGAIERMHDKGIAHGDLHPGNIMKRVGDSDDGKLIAIDYGDLVDSEDQTFATKKKSDIEGLMQSLISYVIGVDIDRTEATPYLGTAESEKLNGLINFKIKIYGIEPNEDQPHNLGNTIINSPAFKKIGELWTNHNKK